MKFVGKKWSDIFVENKRLLWGKKGFLGKKNNCEKKKMVSCGKKNNTLSYIYRNKIKLKYEGKNSNCIIYLSHI